MYTNRGFWTSLLANLSFKEFTSFVKPEVFSLLPSKYFTSPSTYDSSLCISWRPFPFSRSEAFESVTEQLRSQDNLKTNRLIVWRTCFFQPILSTFPSPLKRFHKAGWISAYNHRHQRRGVVVEWFLWVEWPLIC